jgi:hypothetical protein
VLFLPQNDKKDKYLQRSRVRILNHLDIRFSDELSPFFLPPSICSSLHSIQSLSSNLTPLNLQPALIIFSILERSRCFEANVLSDVTRACVRRVTFCPRFDAKRGSRDSNNALRFSRRVWRMEVVVVMVVFEECG